MVDPWNDMEILDYATCKDDSNETVYSYYNLSTISSTELYVHAALLSGIIVLGLCGNMTILLLVICNKKLWHRSTIASLNIVFVDFLLTVFYHGVALASLSVKDWAYGKDDVEICRFYSFMTPYFIYVRWIALSLICIDRFLTVKFPFHYQRNNKLFLIILTVCVWCVPILLSGAILLVGEPTFRTNVPTCLVSCINTSNGNLLCSLLNVVLFTGTFLICGLVPSILYTWMYRRGKALKSRVTMGTFAAHVVATSIGTSPTNFKSISRKLSLNEVNRERSTLTTLILLYLTVLLTSIPQYMLILLRGISICTFFKIPLFVHFLVSDIFFLSTALDPIVLLKNQDFRDALSQIFCRRRRNQLNQIRVTSSCGSIPGLEEEVTSL